MNELNALFRKRIGFPESEAVTFDRLADVLERTAKTVPFENLAIIRKSTAVISKQHLVQKILMAQEGGLCYEINALLYLFLIENGFDAVLTRGVVYNHDSQAYFTMGRTHLTILLTHGEQTYVIDTGFGGNLPLKPVPLSGETITSSNGQFRIKKEDGEYGDYLLEMKLKHKDTDWKTGYTFDSQKPLADLTECNAIRKIVFEHSESRFNKHPLITKRTDDGSITLTDTSFTVWKDGVLTKEQIDRASYERLLKQHFGMSNR
ncbi:N-hydroxyarylamine O-acetyltransferase [Paenibacillus algorifonticola]|uniref:N-hydroxyarylamine O-acetyltransferase n=1 Tax=Paenibacillus algorifonticola TaxID=684063 RepID=A0A1I2FSI3_9BACL|nr:arylamine N-acetyltransferase [Paenibacillus algorifonticola]SFF07456.1 N-hydroxyarylamine O-acetyltransferase [Paenibacillus algorifonticola]